MQAAPGRCGYNCPMSDFKFNRPIQIRYNDLDPQWHVNNARFVSYIEQARFAYILNLGLFDGKSFFDLDLIVADNHIAYLAPIAYDQQIQVGARVTRIGNKSLNFAFQIEDTQTGKVLCTSEMVMVGYDYHAKQSKPIPALWREKISQFEGQSF
jgi:acyl-CoA thioester hydrolase